MKNTGTCPKCGSKQIARFNGLSGHNGTGSMLCVGVTIFNSVPINHYVCCDCGYVESWIDKGGDLNKVKESRRAKIQ